MFISKMMGLIANTAEMDYLATMAGVNLNDYENQRTPHRKLARIKAKKWMIL